MADYILDRFGAADDTLIHNRTAETGETWTAQISAMKIASARAICSSDGVRAICTLPTAWSDVSVEINLRVANIEGGVAGIVLRWTDSNNYWLFRMYREGGNAFRLYEVNGGAETLRAFDNPAFNITDDIKVRAVANAGTITVTATQGATSLQIQYASATHNQSATTHGIVLEQAEDSVNDVLVWSGAGEPPANPLYTAITLTSPAALQVFQRSGTTGDIVIAGTFSGGGTHDIEASFNGGAYQTIDEDASGTFSGTLTGQAEGQGTVTVRFVDDTGVTATANYVGIGDVFVLAGQSNMSGRGTVPQTWSHATLYAAQFGNNYTWAQLAAVNDSSVAQVDAVSSDADAAQNYIPRLATAIMADQSVPVAFIPCAMGGTAISSWLPGANHQDRTTLYGSMVYRALQVGAVKAVLFHQGESDATVNGFTGGATYKTRLKSFADAVWADLAAPVVVCRIHCWSGAPDTSQANVNEINAAMASAALENSHVLLGPNFDSPTPVTTSLHFTTDADMIEAAARFWTALDRLFYTTAEASTAPQIRLATVNDYWPLDAYLPIAVQALDDSGQIADADGVPSYLIYNAATGGVVVSASMAAVTTGLYTAQVQLTTAAGFVSGGSYVLRVVASMSDKLVSDLAVFRVGSSELAASAVTEIADAVWDEALSGHVAAGSTGKAVVDILEDTATTLPAALAVVDANVDAIKLITDTLDVSAVTQVAASSAGHLTITAGLTYSDGVTGLTIPADWETAIWTLKHNAAQADTAAVIQLRVTNPADAEADGLQRLNGVAVASPITAADGTLTVTQASGRIDIWLSDELTLLLSKATGLGWDVKFIDANGDSTGRRGAADVVLTETQAVA